MIAALSDGSLVFTLVLLETELERVPAELQDDPRIRARAASRDLQPADMLLDAAYDGDALRGHPEGARRGRPDLAHAFLRMAMDSPLHARGELRAFVHTRHDDVLVANPRERCPPHHATFVRHVEALYLGASHAGPYSLMRGVGVEKLLENHTRGPRLLLDERGEPADLRTFEALEGPATLCIGGFPEGRLRRTRADVFDRRLSLQDDQLAVWSVLVPILAGLGSPARAPKG